MSDEPQPIDLVPGAILAFCNDGERTRTLTIRTSGGGYVQAVLPPGGRIGFLGVFGGARVEAQDLDGEVWTETGFSKVYGLGAGP
jgi:hypothetical protein